jgi:hypothetical protein
MLALLGRVRRKPFTAPPAASDDIEALDALLDAGADTEADGAAIAGGTLGDAVALPNGRRRGGCGAWSPFGDLALPRCSAVVTAPARSSTPNFPKMRTRCVLTVASLIDSASRALALTSAGSELALLQLPSMAVIVCGSASVRSVGRRALDCHKRWSTRRGEDGP